MPEAGRVGSDASRSEGQACQPRDQACCRLVDSKDSSGEHVEARAFNRWRPISRDEKYIIVSNANRQDRIMPFSDLVALVGALANERPQSNPEAKDVLRVSIFAGSSNEPIEH